MADPKAKGLEKEKREMAKRIIHLLDLFFLRFERSGPGNRSFFHVAIAIVFFTYHF